MKIVADESVDFRIVAALSGEGYDVWAVTARRVDGFRQNDKKYGRRITE